jgi:chromosome segregation ATPase
MKNRPIPAPIPAAVRHNPTLRARHAALRAKMRHKITDRNELAADLADLDAESMPAIAAEYRRKLAALNQQISRTRVELAAIEAQAEADAEAGASTSVSVPVGKQEAQQRMRRLQIEEQQTLRAINGLGERAERGENVREQRAQFNWRLERVRAELAAIDAVWKAGKPT